MAHPKRNALARLLPAATLALLLAAVPALAVAHVHLVSSSPAAGDNLEAAPTEVMITFDGELDPAQSGFTVIDADGSEVGGGEVDLGVADRNVLRGAVTISEPGVYTVEYLVVGEDGHEVSGSFSFGYATQEEIPEPDSGEHDTPDTALPASGPPVVSLLGLLLLLLAGVSAARSTRLG